MSDDAIRERHGVSCREGQGNFHSFVTIWESEDTVHINGESSVRNLTEWQARYLAAKLYRLSRRIRARREALEQST